MGLAGGLNLYGFAGGDPINSSDAFGLCTDGDRLCEIAKAIAAKAGPLTKIVEGGFGEATGINMLGRAAESFTSGRPVAGAFQMAMAMPVFGEAKVAGELGTIDRQVGNILSELGAHDHLAAARAELSGATTFGDHVHELTDFANGLRSSAVRLQRMLGADGLSAASREEIQGMLSRVSNLRDQIMRAIGPR